jgi:germination protein M
MKRLLILLLCMVLLLSGCGTSQPKMEDPVTFYYPRTEYIYGQSDSVIAPETREAAGIKTNLSALLHQYIQGPISAELRSPFPAGTKILEIRQEDGILQLTLNDQFSQLSGMELTIACACTTKTCLSLTSCQTVQITLDGTTPENQRIITMDAQTLLLMDDIITATPTETQEGL